MTSRRRRVFLSVALLLLAGVAVTLVVRRDAGSGASHIPMATGALADSNVVLVSIDTLRADRLGCYGYEQAETPNLDALAARGVRCAQAVAPAPLTLPSHASLLTGRDPQLHGARANVIYSLPESARTLAEVLREQGYRTAAFISAFVLDRRFGLSQGFDDYHDDLTADGRTKAFGYRERLAEDTNGHVLAWLGAHAGEKFFVWVHYFDPHFPYAAPEPFGARHAGRPYDAEIAYTDEQLGRLLTGLDEMGLADETLVVVVSDHGESLGEHQELTHGLLLYDATLRVPMIFGGPAPLPQGLVLDGQVGLIDVMPTILDMLGHPAPEGSTGVSLLRPDGGSVRTHYAETLWPRVMHNWSPLSAVRRDGMKLIEAPTPELYDLRADPGELNNLYERRQETAAAMHEELLALGGGDPGSMASETGNLPVDPEALERLAGLGYVVAPAGPSSTEALPDPKDMMGKWSEIEQAVEMVLAGRNAEAIAVLEPFVHHNPGDVRAIGLLAECYLRSGRFSEAAEAFRRHAELSVRKAEPLAGLALARFHMGRLEEAEEAARMALEVDPQLPAGLFCLGLIAGKRGDDDAAMKYYEQSVEAGRGNQTSPAYYNIGVLHERAGRMDDAREAFEQALELDSGYVNAATSLARILEAGERYDEAIRVLDRAVGKRPEPDARLELARLLTAVGQVETSARHLEHVLEHRPDSAVATCALGMAQRRLGRRDEAIAHLARCVELDAGNIEAHVFLGVLLAESGRPDQARAHLETVVEAAPDWSSGHYYLGVVLGMQRQVAEAERAFARAVQLDPNNAMARNALGEVWLATGRRAEAIAAFRKVLEIAPDFERARQNLGKAETQ